MGTRRATWVRFQLVALAGLVAIGIFAVVSQVGAGLAGSLGFPAVVGFAVGAFGGFLLSRTWLRWALSSLLPAGEPGEHRAS